VNVALRRWLVAAVALAGLAALFGACSSNDNGGVINPPPSTTTSSVP
jgi:hypothetical protein